MLNFLTRFVDSNDRELKRIQPFVDEANALEDEFRALTDQEIRKRMLDVRAEVAEDAAPTEPSEDELEHAESERRAEFRKEREKADLERLREVLDGVLPEVFAAGREISRRTLGMRHFDVQLLGAVVLHQGKIAEMKTGEGKTLAAPLAAALNAMSGRGVHVVTVNDYLAKRDPQWMGPIYHGLGLSVGVIQHEAAFLYDPDYRATEESLMHLRPVERREAYAADVTYGTNNEFGFDYLRDNMVVELDQRVQRERYFAIVDEVDNILIDEARTPLIISGQAEESADLYYRFARLAPRLKARAEGEDEGGDYFVDLKEKAVSPTEEGIDKIEKLLGIENLFDADPRLARHFEQALRAHALYKRDRDYIVKEGEIVIVDEFTGRQMPGRRWSEGLHQAIEAKEGLRVQRESVTLATITFQNYFRLYHKLAGMTGTAMTEGEEFHKIYKLEVTAIPTNQPMIRDDFPDLVFRTEQGKFSALIDEIVELREQGRPVLVGTVTVEKSEHLSEMLNRRGIHHEVLNAKYHEREASIVAQAGRSGAVTISTNMAGRGTDIQLGGNPAGLASEALHRRGINPADAPPEVYAAALDEARAECAADHEAVVAAGGLHIIGTERHDARRIDNQLRGRSGRQGDPGSSRFYLSLEDDLMKRFASDRVAGLMERMGLEEDVAIESRIVSRTIESAQSRVEGYNFDIRKRVVEYDDVINKQRETIYAERDKVLRNEDLTETVRTFLDQEIGSLVDRDLAGDDAGAWDVDALAGAVNLLGLTGDAASADELWAIADRSAIEQHLRDLADARLTALEEEHGAETWALVERIVLLRAIDALWVEHLTELDDMRRGIGLRGYSGEDPLNAFKKEAYSLYEELRELIRHQVATTIFRVNVVRQEPAPLAQPLPGPGQRMPDAPAAVGAGAVGGVGSWAPQGMGPLTGAAGGVAAGVAGASGAATLGAAGTSAASGGGGRMPARPGGVPPERMAPALRGLGRDTTRELMQGSIDGARGQARPAGIPKLGRNDPCYCGSGLKYKKCHGR
ncbi:MAG TPA: preprotein translocase subunit SecA [Candidatus Acidoferrales bacterium]|nr:preprotein translocase subunit SecA [Candidatus Acidoferrales bacterium]